MPYVRTKGLRMNVGQSLCTECKPIYSRMRLPVGGRVVRKDDQVVEPGCAEDWQALPCISMTLYS